VAQAHLPIPVNPESIRTPVTNGSNHRLNKPGIGLMGGGRAVSAADSTHIYPQEFDPTMPPKSPRSPGGDL